MFFSSLDIKKKIIISLTLFISLSQSLYCADPMFSFSSEVIWKGGTGLQNLVGVEMSGPEVLLVDRTRYMYGILRDLSIAVSFPVFLTIDRTGCQPIGLFDPTTVSLKPVNIPTCLRTTAGLGDMDVWLKYRFYQDVKVAKRVEGSVAGGIILPTSRIKGGLTIDEQLLFDENNFRSFTFFLYGIFGYNSRKYSAYCTAGITVPTPMKHQRAGNFYEVTFGIGRRFEQTPFNEPDFVAFIEANLQIFDRFTLNGCTIRKTGGLIFFLGPSFSWTKENFRIRGGIQAPFGQFFRADFKKIDYRGALAFELVF